MDGIVTRPEHDKVTTYLSSWAQDILLFAKEKGVNLADLGAEKVTRKNFEKYLSKKNPKLVFINGHGAPDSIAGHKDEILIKKGENEHILKDKIVYALSCHSAVELGPSAIGKGTKAFIGYNNPFCFLTDKNKECTPEEDELANIFKKGTNQVPLCLVRKKNVLESYNRSQNKFLDLIKEYSASDALPEAKDIRFWLFWDVKSQEKLGEDQASL